MARPTDGERAVAHVQSQMGRIWGERFVTNVTNRYDGCVPAEARELMLFLLRQGNRRDAVRVYQDETGVHRNEAAEAVQQLAQQHGMTYAAIGLADVVLLVVMLGSVLWGLTLG